MDNKVVEYFSVHFQLSVTPLLRYVGTPELVHAFRKSGVLDFTKI